MQNNLKAAVLAALLLAPAAAFAQDAESNFSWNAGVASDYVFRGVSQSNRDIAFQAGVDYAFGDSGFYVGNWNSSVDWLPGNSLETDFYGGYKFKAADVDWDVGMLTYVYSGNANGNTTEIYGSGTYGPFTAKYSHTVSKDYFGWAGAKAGSGLKGRNTGYLQFSYSQEVMPKVTLKASVGYTHFSSDIKDLGVPNYVDYSVGGAYDLGDGFSAGAAVTGANKKAYFGDVNKARLILTLSKTF